MAPIETHRTVTNADSGDDLYDRIETLFARLPVMLDVADYDSDNVDQTLPPDDQLGWLLQIQIDPEDNRWQYQPEGPLSTIVTDALALATSVHNTDGIEQAKLTLYPWALAMHRGFEL